MTQTIQTANIGHWKSNKNGDPNYPYWSYQNGNGEIVYSVPLEAPNEIPEDDTKGAIKYSYSYLPVFGGKNLKVYYWETTDREIAYAQRAWINSEHTRERRRSKREVMVAETRTDVDTSIWDGIQESSYEQKEFPQVERHVLNRIDLENIRKLVNDRNPKLWKVFCMKELNGEDAETIAEKLEVSITRVYQMIATVREIGRKYRQENS